MLLTASVVFVYYTIWAILLVRYCFHYFSYDVDCPSAAFLRYHKSDPRLFSRTRMGNPLTCLHPCCRTGCDWHFRWVDYHQRKPQKGSESEIADGLDVEPRLEGNINFLLEYTDLTKFYVRSLTHALHG